MKPSELSRFSASITPATLAALIAIQVTFASNYLFSKVVMQSVPPLVWGNIRTVCTALILMAALALRGQLRLDAAWKAKKALFLFSLLGVVLNQAAFLAGLQLTTTANSGLINTMIPIFTVLWITITKQEQFSRLRWIGFFLALSGVLILQDLRHFSFSLATYQGDLLTLFNALSYSFFLFFSPPFFKNNTPLWTTAWLFTLGSLGLSVLAIPQWSQFDPSAVSGLTLTYAVLGITLGNLIPYLLISFVLARTSSAIVAQFVYLQALIAGFLGYAFLGETISTRTLFSAVLIFLGLYCSLTTRPFGIRISLGEDFKE